MEPNGENKKDNNSDFEYNWDYNYRKKQQHVYQVGDSPGNQEKKNDWETRSDNQHQSSEIKGDHLNNGDLFSKTEQCLSINVMEPNGDNEKDNNSDFEYNSDYNYRKKQQHVYQVGDSVLLYVPAKTIGMPPKPSRFWKGVYVITKVLSDVHYKVQAGPRSKPKTVHHNQLKIYHPRKLMDTSWAAKMPPTTTRLPRKPSAGQEPITNKDQRDSNSEDTCTEDSHRSKESVSNSEDDEDTRYELAYPEEPTVGEQPISRPLPEPTSGSNCSSRGLERTHIGNIDALQGQEAPRQSLGSELIPENKQETPTLRYKPPNEPLPQREKKPPDRPRRQRKPPDRYSPHK